MIDRERAGREASPTAGVIDSQITKAPMADRRGYDAGEKIVGRIRAACLAAFKDEVVARTCDAFFVRINKEMSIDQKRRACAAAEKRFGDERKAHPGLSDHEIVASRNALCQNMGHSIQNTVVYFNFYLTNT